ncbi:MAG: ATP synthase F1 subunit delta [Clostridiales bacterium]|nr:ATP synthase F1 subunit delta [Clostridiales bacterium]
MSELSREYGGALFELADDEKISDTVLDEISAIKALLAPDSDYVKLLTSPNISISERVACVDKAFSGKVHMYLCSFLKLMTERGYAGKIGDCFAEYERLYNEKNNICVAKVKSAIELSDRQKDALAKRLSARTGRNVRLDCEVDASLVGGISVYVDGELLDGSVSARLSELRRRLSDITV